MKKRLLLILMTAFAVCWQVNAGPVSCYGKLQVNGKDIIGSKTNCIVQVKGVSMGWSNTGSLSAGYFNANTVKAMVDLWNAEIIRVPLGIGSNGGYPGSLANKTRVENVVDAAIAKDVYVIIDWHSHSAHNEIEMIEAKAFFSEMAEKYKNNDHVIFEIYNEPLSTDWNTIKSYADEIVVAIREHSDNLILVGTRKYSQCLHDIKTRL